MSSSSESKELTELAKSVSGHLAKNIKELTAASAGDTAQASLARGKLFQLAGYFEEAAQCFEAALACAPALSEARARLAIMQMRSHQPARALAVAMELAQRDPDFLLTELTSEQQTGAMTILGDALAVNGRVSDAVEAYKNAAKRSAKDVFAAGRLAQAYLSLGDAKSAFDQARMIPANPRFKSLTNLLRLGKESMSIMPRHTPDDMQSMMAVSAHGRPMTVNGVAATASLVRGDSPWCASHQV